LAPLAALDYTSKSWMAAKREVGPAARSEQLSPDYSREVPCGSPGAGRLNRQYGHNAPQGRRTPLMTIRSIKTSTDRISELSGDSQSIVPLALPAVLSSGWNSRHNPYIEMSPYGLAGCERSLTQKPAQSISAFWAKFRNCFERTRCRLFHRSISLPVRGRYRCWECLQEFDTDF